MIWYVHRNKNGSIASAHSASQPGYAEEARDDTQDADMIAHRAAATDPAAATVDDKLARIGLTRAELKEALR